MARKITQRASTQGSNNSKAAVGLGFSTSSPRDHWEVGKITTRKQKLSFLLA